MVKNVLGVHLSRRSALALLLPFFLLFQGCLTYSLHPIGKPEDSQLRPELLGKWMEEGRREGYFVSKAKDGTYEVKKIGRKNILTGILLNLGGVDYLDLSPQTPTEEALHIPVHLILRLKLQEDGKLQITSLDTDWLRKALLKGKIKAAHTELDDDLILTAPSEELRELLTRLAKQPQAFTSDSVVFAKR